PTVGAGGGEGTGGGAGRGRGEGQRGGRLVVRVVAGVGGRGGVVAQDPATQAGQLDRHTGQRCGPDDAVGVDDHPGEDDGQVHRPAEQGRLGGDVGSGDQPGVPVHHQVEGVVLG